MNRQLRIAATLAAAGLLAACTGPGATTAPTGAGQPSAVAGGLLDNILKAGKVVVSTDPAYPPQSEVTAEGTYQGFDIDVATEIARRLGVTVDWQTPAWEAITAGGWGGRWDMSVGSMAITPERAQVLSFSVAYYYTPAQMAASTQSGITTLDGLANKTVCVGEGTTYFSWLNGTLDFGPAGKPDAPANPMTVTTLPTDRDCALQWQQGRHDFEGWLSSSTTVELAVEDGLPLVKVGEPVFLEPLAVATDRSGPDASDFMVWLDSTIQAMHADGFLKTASEKWFGVDLTAAQ